MLSASLSGALKSVRERAQIFFSLLPQGEGRFAFDNRREFLEENGDEFLALQRSLQRLSSELENLPSKPEERFNFVRRAGEIHFQFGFLMESEDRNTVFWIERRSGTGPRGASRNIHLQGTPIDVSQLLSDLLFDSYPSVILTSATLTVQGGFQHVRKRLGLRDTRELIVPSHFRYAEQALLYLPPDMPEPRSPAYAQRALDVIRRTLNITRGRAFCLFTSYAQMRDLHDRLLCEIGYPLLLQGTAPRKALLEQFRETPNAVLFGTSSFWQGVDVQGEQLSCVIIDKLPFAVPSDPVVAARSRAITEEGGNAFYEYQVPSAVITLKQGFGRLIRSLDDRGVLVMLDPRIQQQRYGRVFLESLPPYRVTHNIGDVETFFASPQK
jgi:ATP-dependent DNA helicase DinG